MRGGFNPYKRRGSLSKKVFSKKRAKGNKNKGKSTRKFRNSKINKSLANIFY